MKSSKSGKKTPKTSKKTSTSYENTQPKPLKVVHPPPLLNAAPSPSQETTKESPKHTTEPIGTKRKIFSSKGGSSSKAVKRLKQVNPNSAEEISKEISVGFGLDKYWYDTTHFPQLHTILKFQEWEILMSEFSCHSIFPNLMREFISNFSNDCGMCSSTIKNIKIEFNSALLGEWFNIPNVGFDTYCVGTKIVFSGINEKTIFKYLGVEQKKGKISHNILSPMHKLLYNIARRFILPRNSKRSEVSLRDATLIYCMENQIKINFPSLMISHLSDCIEKRNVVGYGGLLTWIFRKFGVPLEGLEFPMGPNMKIGAKCLQNLHLKLNEEGVLIHESEEVVDVESDEEVIEEEEVLREEEIEEKEGEKVEEKEKEREKEQEPVPTETDKEGDARKGETAE